MVEKKQISIRVPKLLLVEFERHCNGLTFHNRNHGFTVLLQSWLEDARKEGKGEQLNIHEIPGPRKGRKK